MKEAKIVIGANYGDEGKGLMTRFFTQEAKRQGSNPIIIFHNGTAQRGHTVDYGPSFRHIYHHFGSGTAEGAPTFYADTFLIHPMEYVREYQELWNKGIHPHTAHYDANALVITPFDMLVDHVTEDYISVLKGEREFGSCGFGSWCATDRFRLGDSSKITIGEFAAATPELREVYLKRIWIDCQIVLFDRGVDIDKVPHYKDFFYNPNCVIILNNTIQHFIKDLDFFFDTAQCSSFDDIWKKYDYTIFENGQGLGLDINVDNDWHTTSNTGILNPFNMLKDKTDFNAEACYVTRSYLTRHGEGPLEEAVKKSEINNNMVDKTNVFNNFQGELRYGFLEDADQSARIAKDWSIVKDNANFKKTMSITHTNEFKDTKSNSEYFSDNPFTVDKRT